MKICLHPIILLFLESVRYPSLYQSSISS